MFVGELDTDNWRRGTGSGAASGDLMTDWDVCVTKEPIVDHLSSGVQRKEKGHEESYEGGIPYVLVVFSTALIYPHTETFCRKNGTAKELRLR